MKRSSLATLLTVAYIAKAVLVNCGPNNELAKLSNFGKELQLQAQSAPVASVERVIELKLP